MPAASSGLGVRRRLLTGLGDMSARRKVGVERERNLLVAAPFEVEPRPWSDPPKVTDERGQASHRIRIPACVVAYPPVEGNFAWIEPDAEPRKPDTVRIDSV